MLWLALAGGLLGALRIPGSGFAADAPAAPIPLAGESQAIPADESVISLRPRGPWTAPRSLASLLPTIDPALVHARMLRANRLGVIDLALPAGLDAERCLARLSDSGAFEFVEIASRVEWHGVPNDPGFASQWHLHNTGQHGGAIGADIGAAWAFEIEDGDPRVVLAMIDSGVDRSHPDLVANLARNPGEIPGNGRDDDRNGFVDDDVEIDFAPGHPHHASTTEHGTAVAGVIAAAGNNGLGVVGLAGGGRDGVGCSLLSLRIGAHDAAGSAIDDAILEAIDRGARVICLALGVAPSRAIDLALEEARVANVLVIASAGNGGAVSYPARHPAVIAVGGTDRRDAAVPFSRGPEVDVAAPAIDILTTRAGGGYAPRSGTSFAAAQVAALAGLVLSVAPSLATSQIEAILRSTATDIGNPGSDEFAGDGRIDAMRALRRALVARPPRISMYGRSPIELDPSPPIITTNGHPPLAGDGQFAIVLAGAAPARRAWLILGANAIVDEFGQATIAEDPSARALATWTDARGECAIAGLLPPHPESAGSGLFAQWVVEGPAGLSTTRILALTVGD